MMAFLVFPLTFGCAAIAPLLLPLFYGIQFAPAIPSSIVLVAGASIGATATVGSSLIYALERSRFIFWSGIPGAFLSVAAGLLIIPRWGVLGAALSRTGVQFAMVALGVWYIHKKLRCPVPFSSVLRTVVASSVAAFGAYACVQVSSDALMTPAAILVAVSLYFLAVRFMKPLTKEDWAALDKATRFLPRAIMAPTGMVIGLLRGRR
jgi:O-antigen/teichoic acid export membrane protein